MAAVLTAEQNQALLEALMLKLAAGSPIASREDFISETLCRIQREDLIGLKEQRAMMAVLRLIQYHLSKS